MSQVEQPAYTIVATEEAIEIRAYPSLIAAETTSTGDRETAINAGFQKLADYIFGNNTTQQSIAMTAPVTQQSGQNIAQKIDMTAPVTQQGEGDTWRVRFIMPAEYTLETLPIPLDDAVTLVPVPERQVAVIRFSGRASAASLSEQLATLQAFIAARNLEVIGAPMYAFYNPPWTLPFLRRNEIMLELTNTRKG